MGADNDVVNRGRVVVVLAVLVMGLPTIATAAPGPAPATYWVGIAHQSINPDTDGSYHGQPVYLGGYGFTNGKVTGDTPRTATGILDMGVSARAIVIAARNDPTTAMVIETIETQGMFIAYQQGPYGLEDIRRDAALPVAKGGTGISAERIIVGTNHTHGGPDTIGVWGGVPTPYLQHIHDQAVLAIKDAWATRRQATVWAGATDASDLLANQFGDDPNNTAMDNQLRVLQARDATTGIPFATMVNLSAHPTVMNGDNRLISADWSGYAEKYLAENYGGDALAVSATLGRSQPNRGSSFGGACHGVQTCAVGAYGKTVADRADDAIANAHPLTGTPIVDGHSYYIADAGHNALLAGLAVAGGPVGAPISRSITPPWNAGNVFGTVTFSARIGNLLVTGGPGEMYPQITQKLATVTKNHGVAMQFVVGLAGDQLGYILAPFPLAYPEPIRATIMSGGRDDPTSWQVSPIDNDNYLFNVSHTLGDRVTCSLLRGAGELFGAGSAWRSARPRCALYADDLAFAPGTDVGLPVVPAH